MSKYVYKVREIKKFVDGDTVDLVVEKDIGFHVVTRITQRFRLTRIDAPERGEAGANEATAFVVAWFEARAGQVWIESFKDDSFGRWLAEVFVTSVNGRETLNDALMDAGHAVPYVARRR